MTILRSPLFRPKLRANWKFPYSTQFSKIINRGILRKTLTWPLFKKLSIPYFGVTTVLQLKLLPRKRLVIFYMTTKKLLDPQRPLLKFISVKGIILFAYWQSLLLALLDQERFTSSTEKNFLHFHLGFTVVFVHHHFFDSYVLLTPLYVSNSVIFLTDFDEWLIDSLWPTMTS